MSVDQVIAEIAKGAAKNAIEDLAAKGIEFAGDAIDAAAKALRGALAQYPRTVNAKRLEVVDERTLDAPEPGGW